MCSWDLLPFECKSKTLEMDTKHRMIVGYFVNVALVLCSPVLVWLIRMLLVGLYARRTFWRVYLNKVLIIQ